MEFRKKKQKTKKNQNNVKVSWVFYILVKVQLNFSTSKKILKYFLAKTKVH